MSATSKLRRRLRRMVKRDEPLTQGQERAFLRLMKVETVADAAPVELTPEQRRAIDELASELAPVLRGCLELPQLDVTRVAERGE